MQENPVRKRPAAMLQPRFSQGCSLQHPRTYLRDEGLEVHIAPSRADNDAPAALWARRRLRSQALVPDAHAHLNIAHGTEDDTLMTP